MSVSRRRFLKASAVVSAALVLKPGSFVLGQNSLWSNSSTESNSAHTYRREAFEPYIGDVFRVRIGKQMVDLKLVALENVAPASRGITTGRGSRLVATTPAENAADSSLLANWMRVGIVQRSVPCWPTHSITRSRVTSTRGPARRLTR